MSASETSLRPRPEVSLLVAASVWAAVATAPASGQSYVQPPCQATAPKFEDHLQSLWYRRFWTGKCDDLPALGCRSGKPYWNDVVHTLVARAPAAKRQEVAVRACRLGEKIGFEWTRPKTERRIDTAGLQTLDAKLDQAPDVLAGLSAVESSVKAKLGD